MEQASTSGVSRLTKLSAQAAGVKRSGAIQESIDLRQSIKTKLGCLQYSLPIASSFIRDIRQ